MKRTRRGSGARTVEVGIERLGHEGDGVATLDGRPLFVPFTLPGERVRVRVREERRDVLRGEVVDRLSGPERAPPACRHFGTCGGCRLQHLPPETCRRFRLGQVGDELARRRIPFPEPAYVAVPPGSRRRLRLAWRVDGRPRVGFRRLRGHAVVDVAECPVARPELVALLPALRELLGELERARGEGEATVTAALSGIDLLLRLPGPPGLAERERLATFATAQDLARLSVATAEGVEPLAARRPVELAYGLFRVPVPPGAFLQATAEGEAALQRFVAESVPEGARLADLYAGLGALSLPLADRLARLYLVEADTACVEAVTAAVRRAGRSGIGAECRDLERRPLPAPELARFDVVLLDPPRAGALAQVREIAASRVPRVVYASCNPASFARDARILADAGFEIRALTIVDQFLWSSEVELAARLERLESNIYAAL